MKAEELANYIEVARKYPDGSGAGEAIVAIADQLADAQRNAAQAVARVGELERAYGFAEDARVHMADTVVPKVVADRDALRARVRELEGEVASIREHALPLEPTPFAGPATGNDLIDRLRGIYVVPVVGERRFDASAINLEAAARLEVTERDRADAAALLTDCADMLAQAEEYIREDQDEVDEDEVGYLPLIGKVRNLVARLTTSAAGKETDRG